MSPWTLLGWIVLVLLVLAIVVRLLAVVLTFVEQESPKIKASRKRKRALKGKVICEHLGWENEYHPGQEDVALYLRKYDRVKVVCSRVATHATTGTYRRYYCEEHALANRHSSGNDWARPLRRPASAQPKTKVIT